MNPGPAISSLSTASESSTFSIINAARSLGFESIFFAAFIAPLTIITELGTAVSAIEGGQSEDAQLNHRCCKLFCQKIFIFKSLSSKIRLVIGIVVMITGF